MKKENGSKELQFVMDLFETTREEYLSDARAIAEILVKKKETITVNDIRDILPPPRDVDPRVMGAIFKCKSWEKVGYISSNRASICHGRPIAVFKKKQ